ncbi:hypothetical protein Tco_0179604 [Tanacetum coccineum]
MSSSVMANGVMANGGMGSGVMDNGVSESVPHGMVNGVMANGVSVVVRESVFEVVVDGSSLSLGQVASASVGQLDKEHLLAWFVPEKISEFMKETQEKDRDRLIRLQVLGREFELRAGEKNHFIEKLKGNVDF